MHEVKQHWNSRVIDACSLYVHSDTDCLLTLPVMTKVYVKNSAGHDVNFLLRTLALDTFADFENTRLYQEQIGLKRIVSLAVLRHKKEEIHIGDHCMVLAHCRSDRPAFVIRSRADHDLKWTEIMHLYAAMGLPQQHWLQQSLLARCYLSHSVALCLLSSIKELLHCSDCTLSHTEGVSTECLNNIRSAKDFPKDFFPAPTSVFPTFNTKLHRDGSDSGPWLRIIEALRLTDAKAKTIETTGVVFKRGAQFP